MENNLEYKRCGGNADTMFKGLKISIGSSTLVFMCIILVTQESHIQRVAVSNQTWTNSS
jgi:hypothetical protein